MLLVVLPVSPWLYPKSVCMVNELTLDDKTLLQSLIAARDKARDELGSELQDNVCQLLASAQLLLRIVGQEGGSNTGLLNKGLLHLGMAMAEIRKITQSFNAGVVHDLGLEAAIRSLLEAAPPAISTFLDFDDDLEQQLSPALKLMVYRIIQEQTDNIYRYANAACLSVELRLEDDQLYFSISDDGKGFNTQQPRKGMGFIIIQNRVASFHGSFSLLSAPGTGCHLEIRVPLNCF